MKNKNLTENLKIWRKDRNITKADYLTFVGNILEELLEPVYEKPTINDIKNKIIEQHFTFTFDDLRNVYLIWLLNFIKKSAKAICCFPYFSNLF